MKTVDLLLPGLGRARVNLYHSCPAYACGAIATTGCLARWWAEASAGGWVFMWDSGGLAVTHAREHTLEQAVADLLGRTPAQLVAAAQDAAAEQPSV